MDLYKYLTKRKMNDRTFADKDFAKEIGVHHDYLSQIKNNHMIPSVELAKKIELITKGEVAAYELLEICLPKRKIT